MRIKHNPTNPYEDEEAMALHQYLTMMHIPHNHRPNEGGKGQAGKLRSMKMKAQGVSAGAWDYEVFIPLSDGSYQQVEIELKRRKGGVVSQAQKDWQFVYEKAGIPCKVCRGWEEAKDFITEERKKAEKLIKLK